MISIMENRLLKRNGKNMRKCEMARERKIRENEREKELIERKTQKRVCVCLS